jgi:hypothetical protein
LVSFFVIEARHDMELEVSNKAMTKQIAELQEQQEAKNKKLMEVLTALYPDQGETIKKIVESKPAEAGKEKKTADAAKAEKEGK